MNLKVGCSGKYSRKDILCASGDANPLIFLYLYFLVKNTPFLKSHHRVLSFIDSIGCVGWSKINEKLHSEIEENLR